MQAACVFDIGGSNFRCAVYRNSGLVRGSIGRSKTPNYLRYGLDAAGIWERLIAAIVREYEARVRRFGSLPVLAVAFPGPVSAAGEVAQSCVIFGETLASPCDLRSELAARFGSRRRAPERILITNDMTASAWRYSRSGHDPYCLITVSSGIGNKIFANGRVLIGPDGFAGEIGHYEADLGGVTIPCSCGTGSNHIGAISSGRGVEAIARAFGGPGGRFEALFRDRRRDAGLGVDAGRLTSEVVAAAADRGDPFCRAVIDFCTGPLAGAVSLLALALYLKRVILIGGFALNCRYYRTSLVRNTIRRGIYNATPDRIRRLIVRGEHDDDHALIGAGIMAAAEGAGGADGLRPCRS